MCRANRALRGHPHRRTSRRQAGAAYTDSRRRSSSLGAIVAANHTKNEFRYGGRQTMTQVQERSTTENTCLAGPKLTAAQVENDCPRELQDLAKHINTHLDKAHKYEDRANQHTTSAAQHLARAKELCD